MIGEWSRGESSAVLDEVCAPLKLQTILVAQDGSAAAERALGDAIALGHRYGAEIVMAHVLSPDKEESTPVCDLGSAIRDLAGQGLGSRALYREGSVSDVLLRLSHEEGADLLLLGAYGHGDSQRTSLGSTAEHVLRSVTCPVVTYGPQVRSSLLSSEHCGPALLPISVPCVEEQVMPAVAMAQLLGVTLEVFHSVTQRDAPHEVRWFERECRAVAGMFRKREIATEWSYLFGQPDSLILAKCFEANSPFILMPLKARSTLSTAESDNVAAGVIRRSKVPVVSYRFECSCL